MQRSLFEKNLKELSRKDKELGQEILRCPLDSSWSIFFTNSGYPTLIIGDQKFDPGENPHLEAKTQVSRFKEKFREGMPSELKVFGIGMFYHIEALLEAFPSSRVIVYEPEIKFLRALCESRDITPYIDRVYFSIGKYNIPWDGQFDYLHHPSLLFHRDFFAFLRKQRLINLNKLPGFNLNILVVGPVYGGSLSISVYVQNALRKMGYQVTYLDFSPYEKLYFNINKGIKNEHNKNILLNNFSNLLSKYAVAKVADIDPDLVLALAQAPLASEDLEIIRQAGIPTAMWFVENYRMLTYWKQMARHYDYFFIIQKGAFEEELRKMGIERFCYVPVAADLDIHKPMELPPEEARRYGSDVSFMGAAYTNRRNAFARLANYNFKIWGSGWDQAGGAILEKVQEGGRWVTTEETVKIYNASKINLNLHSSIYFRSTSGDHDFINPRTFEIAACKGFQLVDKRAFLDEMFDIGTEIAVFQNEEELTELINYFLTNEKERKEIAEEGYKRVQRDHSYVHRMERILNFIWDTKPSRWEKVSNDMKISRKIMDELAEEDQELRKFLQLIPHNRFYTLDEMMQVINSSRGDFKDFELMFLLLKEFKNELERKI